MAVVTVPTPNNAWPVPTAANDGVDFATGLHGFAGAVDAMWLAPGTISARPAASSVPRFALYQATDTGLIYRSTGSAWLIVMPTIPHARATSSGHLQTVTSGNSGTVPFGSVEWTSLVGGAAYAPATYGSGGGASSGGRMGTAGVYRVSAIGGATPTGTGAGYATFAVQVNGSTPSNTTAVNFPGGTLDSLMMVAFDTVSLAATDIVSLLVSLNGVQPSITLTNMLLTVEYVSAT